MGYVFFCASALFALLLIPMSASAVEAAAEGLRLFALDVVPSLFPFLVCSHCLLNSQTPAFGNARVRIVASPLLAALCGTPSAALMLNGYLCADAALASVYCAALNQAGPVFIVSALSYRFLGSGAYALPLAVSHYAPSLVAALVIGLRFGNELFAGRTAPQTARRSMLSVFSASLSDSVSVMLRIGGMIVFFRVLCAEAGELVSDLHIPPLIEKTLMGMLEMTNGLKAVSTERTRLSLSLCAFLLSFGGVCIFMQSKLVFDRLKAAPYFIAKLCLSLVSGSVMWAWYPHIADAEDVFGFTGERLDEFSLFPESFWVFCGFALAVSLTLLFFYVGARLVKKS